MMKKQESIEAKFNRKADEAGPDESEATDDEPAGEDLFIAALKERFDAEEVEAEDT